jgi:hypothetical protein
MYPTNSASNQLPPIYTATKLWDIHPELRRRVIPVWLPPYSDKRRGDEPHYLRLLKMLSANYTFSRGDLLYTMANDILAATGGVFAEITQLLDRATHHALLEGTATGTRKPVDECFGSACDGHDPAVT